MYISLPLNQNLIFIGFLQQGHAKNLLCLTLMDSFFIYLLLCLDRSLFIVIWKSQNVFRDSYEGLQNQTTRDFNNVIEESYAD